jgi:hypothetical protein
MNKPVLLLSVSFFLLSNSYAQQYTWVDLTGNLPDPGVFGGLGKVFFIGEDGWITQSWYTLPREIYYTHDGGQTFILSRCRMMPERLEISVYGVTTKDIL